MRLLLTIPVLLLLPGCSGSTDPLDAPAEAQQGEVQNPGTSDQEEVDLPDEYPSPDEWKHATKQQAARAKRSFLELARRKAPVYPGPLFVNDDAEVKPQTAQDAARRLMILWAVALRGEGIPKEEARGIIDKVELWKYVSPDEKKFLDDPKPSEELSQENVWRLECVWVLLWALGDVEQLDWPTGMCDVKTLAEFMNGYEDDVEFVSKAKLRPVAELLNAQDLTMRIHWAVRDAALHGSGAVPEGLDWNDEADFLPVNLSPSVGVVEERHRVLNWLVNFLSPRDWDHVDTPT